MFSTLVPEPGYCVQPIYRTLVPIADVSLSGSGPQSTAVISNS